MEKSVENTRIKKESYMVEGMTCSGCERTVQRVITSLPGVKVAKADSLSASVSLTYDPTQVTIDSIRASVEKVGYKMMGQLPSAG